MNVVFAEGVTLDQLNPHNFSLKNQYMDNLISTAFMVFPQIRSIIGHSKAIIVKRGFLSNYYLNSHYDRITPDLSKHSKGLAYEITWKDYDVEDAHLVARTIFEYAQYENLSVRIVIKLHKDTISIIRNVSKSEIKEQNESNFRTIKK